jgi:hypothetical protein
MFRGEFGRFLCFEENLFYRIATVFPDLVQLTINEGGEAHCYNLCCCKVVRRVL